MTIAILLTGLLWTRLLVAQQQAPVFPRGGVTGAELFSPRKFARVMTAPRQEIPERFDLSSRYVARALK
jgi:hypothetical protein